MNKNYVEQVAAMFGKKLDEDFTVKVECIDGGVRLFECHFSKAGLIKNSTYDRMGGLLSALLAGEAVIDDGQCGEKSTAGNETQNAGNQQ